MTPTIHITENGRVWPAEEIAALGEVFTTDAPLDDLRRVLEARGYHIGIMSFFGGVAQATVEHDVPAVTASTITDAQIQEELGDPGSPVMFSLATARRCAAAINARRGAR